jgi:hypothetical protein
VLFYVKMIKLKNKFYILQLLENILIMNKILLIIVSTLAFSSSIAMYIIGKDSSHLSELYDLFWIPLPLGVLALLGALKTKK